MFLTSTKKVIRKFQQTNVRVCVQFVGVGLYIYCCTIALNCCNHKRLRFKDANPMYRVPCVYYQVVKLFKKSHRLK